MALRSGWYALSSDLEPAMEFSQRGILTTHELVSFAVQPSMSAPARKLTISGAKVKTALAIKPHWHYSTQSSVPMLAAATTLPILSAAAALTSASASCLTPLQTSKPRSRRTKRGALTQTARTARATCFSMSTQRTRPWPLLKTCSPSFLMNPSCAT